MYTPVVLAYNLSPCAVARHQLLTYLCVCLSDGNVPVAAPLCKGSFTSEKCCAFVSKLALPTTLKNNCVLIWFSLNHKRKPDEIDLISLLICYVKIFSCCVLYLYFPDFHCHFWYYRVMLLFFLFVLFNFLHKLWKQLHFNPEREYWESKGVIISLQLK